jgi:hypothetical protein
MRLSDLIQHNTSIFTRLHGEDIPLKPIRRMIRDWLYSRRIKYELGPRHERWLGRHLQRLGAFSVLEKQWPKSEDGLAVEEGRCALWFRNALCGFECYRHTISRGQLSRLTADQVLIRTIEPFGQPPRERHRHRFLITGITWRRLNFYHLSTPETYGF